MRNKYMAENGLDQKDYLTKKLVGVEAIKEKSVKEPNQPEKEENAKKSRRISVDLGKGEKEQDELSQDEERASKVSKSSIDFGKSKSKPVNLITADPIYMSWRD